jgi:HEAT repeat protein
LLLFAEPSEGPGIFFVQPSSSIWIGPFYERLAAQMWGLSMESVATAPGNGQPSASCADEKSTQQLRQLGKEAVSALLLALGDPDVQMRRNAALVLGDLAGGV